jgi:hypothetical protein
MSDKTTHLRLRLPREIAHEVHKLALSRGASDSQTAVKLIGAQLEAMRLAARTSNDSVEKLVSFLTARPEAQ